MLHCNLLTPVKKRRLNIMTAISICLLRKDSVIKEGVKSLLAKNDFSIVAEYDGLAEIPLEKAESQPAAQLVVSIDEGADSLANSIHKLKNIYTQSRIVIISGNAETSAIMSAFDAGVDGLILKDISCEGLIGSVKLAAAGEKVYPASMLMLPAANSNSA